MEAKLEAGEDGKQAWTTKDATGALKEQIIELAALGMNKTEIAQELQCDRSTVYRNIERAIQNGELIPPRKKKRRAKNDPDE